VKSGGRKWGREKLGDIIWALLRVYTRPRRRRRSRGDDFARGERWRQDLWVGGWVGNGWCNAIA